MAPDGMSVAIKLEFTVIVSESQGVNAGVENTAL